MLLALLRSRSTMVSGLVATLLLAPGFAQAPASIMNTIAGGYLGDGGSAVSAILNGPNAVAIGPNGAVYIADTYNHRIRRVDSSGTITTFAGSGNSGFGGDGGLATSAQLWAPQGLAVGPDGSVYIADTFNHRIRRVGVDGRISTVAGIGVYGASGDGGPATSAQLNYPLGVAVGPDGSIYIVDTGNQKIRRVTTDGKISTFAGTGTAGFNGDSRSAASAQLRSPEGVAVRGDGVVFIADTDNDRIRQVGLDGQISTVAGVGTDGPNGDGGPATAAQLSLPASVSLGPDGSLFIADTNNGRIRRVGTDGNISTVAGGGYLGDGSPAALAQLNDPVDVAVAADGSFYIADSSGVVRRVGTDASISTLAGMGLVNTLGDGGTATSAQLLNPNGVAVGADGIYIADTQNSRIRRVGLDGTIVTVAGTGSAGYSGDFGLAVNAQLNAPNGIAIGVDGSIYIADTGNQTIRRVGPDGTIFTVAGSGTSGSGGDGGAAVNAQLRYPFSVAVVADGSFYIADTDNNRIRRVGPDGTISTVAGNGASGFSGDGGAASKAQLAAPHGVAVGPDGSLYIADTNNQRVRRVGTDGKISTFAGTGLIGFGSDGGPATSGLLFYPGGVASGIDGSIYIADTSNERIRRVGTDGRISTVAGTGGGGFGGDGGLAVAARISNPSSVAAGPDGSIYIADNGNSRVRRVTSVASALSALSIISGNNQAAPPGGSFLPLVVKLANFSGAGVSGATVSFTINSGSGSLSAGSAQTDGNGLAQVSVQAGATPGPLSVSASTGAMAGGSTVIFGLTVSAPVQPALTSSVSQLSFTGVSGGASPSAQQIALATSGAPVNFSVQTSGGNWLQVTPSQSTTPATLTVNASTASLAPNSYPGTITITSSGASNSPLVIPVLLTVGQPSNTQVTLTTTPPGLLLTVDGTAVATPRDFSWVPGSSHTVDVPSPQGTGPTRYAFDHWSQGGSKSQTIIAPSSTTTYTAALAAQHLLTTGLNPSSGGTLTASPGSPDGYYAASTPVLLTATAASGYTFSSYSGDLSSAVNPQTVTMSTPRNVTANFAVKIVNTQVTIVSVPPGQTIIVDQVPIVAPATVTWQANSVHMLEVQSPQGVGSTRYAFSQWSNGGLASQSVTTPSSATTYTASFTTQYSLVAAANPASGGAVNMSPASADGFYAQGTQVQLTAAPASNFTFTGFSGDLAGSANPQSVSVSGPKNVSAAFAPILPLSSTPTQLSLTATQGSNAIGTLQITGGAPGQSVNVGVDQSWLRVNPSQGTVPFSVNVVAVSTDLAPGLQPGKVTLGGTLVVPVTFQVNQPPPTPKLVSSALATGLQFNAVVGSTAPAAQSIPVNSSDGSTPLSFTAVINYSPGAQNWATLSASSGTTPSPVNVGLSLDPSLQAGSYTAVVVLSSPGSPDASIPVTLHYTAPLPQLQVSLQEVTLASAGEVKSSPIVVSSTAPGPLTLNVATQTRDGNNWLKASPPSTSVANQQAAVLQVSADPAGLAAGTYVGSIQILDTTQQATTVPVIFAVNPGSKSLASALATLPLRVGASQTKVAAIPLELLAYGTNPVTFSAQADKGWIQISPATGVIQPGSTAGSPQINFDLSQLVTGPNKGLITITSDATGGPISITVEVDKAQQGVPVSQLSPVGLVVTPPFTISQDPAFVPSTPTTKLSITAPPWLTVDDRLVPGLAPGTIHQLHITVNGSSLDKGVPNYGTITVTEPGNGLASLLSVLAYIPNPGSPENRTIRTGDAASASACVPTKYIALGTSFGQNLQLQNGAPASTEITVIDDCGNPATTGVAGGVVSNGDPQLNLRSLGDGRWKTTWNPTTPSSYVSLSFIAADPSNGLTPATPVIANSSVDSVPLGPVLDKNQPFETEAGVRLPVLSPGMRFLIRGQNFLNPDGSKPLVLIGGTSIDVVSATNTQLVISTPADLTLNVQMQFLVQRTDGSSVPQLVIIAPSWPVIAGNGASENEAIITGLGKASPDSLSIDGARILKVERLEPCLWRVVADRKIAGRRLRTSLRP